MTFNEIVLIAYACWLVFMSLVTFVLFKKDKKMASKGGSGRIKEKTLLSSTAIGGALGAFVGRIVSHHKTDKKYFSFVILLSLLVQILVCACLVALVIWG